MEYPPDSASMRVALCQVYTDEWACAENLARTLAALERAGEQGAELAITPECVLHGYARRCDGFLERIRTAAEPLDGPAVRRIRDKAAELKLAVVFGFAEKAADDTFHNSAVLIQREGDIAAVYRKVHCRHFEAVTGDGLFTPGDGFTVCEVPHGGHTSRVGLMICFDREVPESVRCLRSLGAELVACPLATNTWRMDNTENRADNEMITRVRAAENEVFIVVVNHAGRFNGGSFAVGPMGDVFCQMDDQPGVRVVDLPVGAIGPQYHDKPLGWMGWGYRRQAVYDRHLKSRSALLRDRHRYRER
ncbi:MAG: carbon-nitrogen hydrolase family protein [Kiritimatiellae bacterium]|nr:carbon-nitrogen hydrolase family protein [Kiritimatiellia bacterium]